MPDQLASRVRLPQCAMAGASCTAANRRGQKRRRAVAGSPRRRKPGTRGRGLRARLNLRHDVTIEHPFDRCRAVAGAALVEVSGLLQLSRDLAEASPLAGLRARSSEPLRHRDGLSEFLGPGGVKTLDAMLAAFGFAGLAALPIAGTLELRDERSLLELSDGAEHLPGEGGGRSVVDEAARAVGRDQLDALIAKQPVAGFLDDQVTGKAVGGFDDDRPDTVRGDPLQGGREARPRVDRIGAGDCSVVKPIDDLDPSSVREPLNRIALTVLRILVRPDVGGARRAQIADRCFSFSDVFCYDL